MEGTDIDVDILRRFQRVAATSAKPLSEMSMEELAEAIGMTRVTLYRRAGTRATIVEALARLGIDADRAPDVHERVVTAATELIRERPVADLTLEQIARRAGCSLPAIYDRFGGRQGVLKAMFERHSPLIPVQALLETSIDLDVADLYHDVQLLYRTVFDLLLREWSVLRAFVVEVLRDPNSEVGVLFRTWYVPSLSAVLIPFFTAHIERGTIRPLPMPLVLQMFAPPMAIHVVTRGYVLAETPFELPDPETTVELMTGMFCRAVAPDRAT